MRERGRQSAGSNVVDVIKFTQDCDRRQAGAGTATTRIRHFSHRSGEFLSSQVIASTNTEQIVARQCSYCEAKKVESRLCKIQGHSIQFLSMDKVKVSNI